MTRDVDLLFHPAAFLHPFHQQPETFDRAVSGYCIFPELRTGGAEVATYKQQLLSAPMLLILINEY